MTPFEITITILAVIIVLRLYFIAYRVTTIWDANNFIHLEIKKALNDISQQLDNFRDDVVDDLRDNRLADKLKELDRPPFTNPMDFPWASCYLPNGNCPNPQRDCINCPRRGEAGSWTTTSNNIETTNND